MQDVERVLKNLDWPQEIDYWSTARLDDEGIGLALTLS
jgi:hypothetical protein